ncbi:MAG: toprim domain-containing protein, partial [Anaerolineae bacterium]|nr:toprim domain-containing protein [Anaerolineae bacterium]
IARAYVAKRSLSAETVETFLLGYAPDGWQTTLLHLQELGYSVEDAVAAGVAIYKEDTGRVYDRFRQRLVIPIRDGRGRVIGFGARALRPEDQPKYLNSPQSEVFDKSTVLFGLDLARREIRERETAVIVEGYMDVMQAHQAGFGNVVAQMGTALTEPQLTTLRRYADRLILALDPDTAGIQATQRGLEVVRQKITKPMRGFLEKDHTKLYEDTRTDFDIRILSLPSGYDPDDLIREQPDEWMRLVREAEPLLEYVLRIGMATVDIDTATAAEREKLARELLPLLTATESRLQEEFNVQRLAMELRLPEKWLIDMAHRSRLGTIQSRPTSPKLRQRRRTAAMDQATLRQDAQDRQDRQGRQERTPQTGGPRHDAAPGTPPPEGPPRLMPETPASDAWVEGPRPTWDESAAPPPGDDYDVGPLGDEAHADDSRPPDAPPPAGTARSARGPAHSMQAGYCLGLLLARPELLFQADRALREVAEAALASFTDEARQEALRHALGPLDGEDFADTAYRAIFAAVRASLWQDDLEPQAYIMQMVDASFHAELAALHEQERDPVGQLPLAGALQQEPSSIRKQQRKEGRVLAAAESELVTAALNLRKERLRRASEELRFLYQDADAASSGMVQNALDANRRAMICLDREIKDREQVLYDR